MATYPDRVDFSTFFDSTGRPDLDPNWTPISGPRAVMEHIARRWVTEKGEMDDPTYGYPVTRYYNSQMLPQELRALQQGLRAEALKVEGVDDAQVLISHDRDGKVFIRGEVVLTDSDLPWQFVFSLSADKLALITLLGPSS